MVEFIKAFSDFADKHPEGAGAIGVMVVIVTIVICVTVASVAESFAKRKRNG